MRCTRCDRIMIREVLGQDARGRLVFGWCMRCVTETGCVPCEGPALPLRVSPPPPARRLARAVRRCRQRLRSSDPGVQRRLIAAGLAGLMCSWGVALGVVGLLRWFDPGPPSAVSGLGNGTAPMLLTGSTALCLLSLVLGSTALATSSRPTGLRAAVGGLVGLLTVVAVVGSLSRAIPAPSGWVLALALIPCLATALAWFLGRRRGRSRAGRRSSHRSTRPERA